MMRQTPKGLSPVAYVGSGLAPPEGPPKAAFGVKAWGQTGDQCRGGKRLTFVELNLFENKSGGSLVSNEKRPGQIIIGVKAG